MDIPNNIELPSIRILFKASRRTQVKKIILTIEGSFNIRNIKTVADALRPLLSIYDHIDIQTGNIESIDLSAIQFLHVLKTFFHTQEKQLSLSIELSSEDERTLTAAGFYQIATKSLTI